MRPTRLALPPEKLDCWLLVPPVPLSDEADLPLPVSGAEAEAEAEAGVEAEPPRLEPPRLEPPANGMATSARTEAVTAPLLLLPLLPEGC
jgi:hypothetical protein